MNNSAPVNLRIILLTSFALSISIYGWSQSEGMKVYDVSRTRVIDHAEYDEIKGSPYLYDEWHPARLLDSKGIFHDFLNVNFNGFTHKLETKEDNSTEEFLSGSYLKIIVNTGVYEETFLRGIHPEFGRNLVCILYDGQEVKLIKKFEVRLEESVVQTTGIPTVFEMFAETIEYYIMIEGDLSKVKTKKKSIIEVLGYKSELESYIKKEKLNLNSESDIRNLIAYYESLI